MNNNIYGEKKKFNVVDALIIVLFVIMLLVVIFRAQLISLFNDNGKRASVEISFECEAIDNEIASSVTDQSILQWVEADTTLGTLTITSAPTAAQILYYNDDGELCVRTSETQQAFSGTIRGTAINNNGCYIDGTDFLASGMTITVTNGKAQFTVLITSVTFK